MRLVPAVAMMLLAIIAVHSANVEELSTIDKEVFNGEGEHSAKEEDCGESNSCLRSQLTTLQHTYNTLQHTHDAVVRIVKTMPIQIKQQMRRKAEATLTECSVTGACKDSDVVPSKTPPFVLMQTREAYDGCVGCIPDTEDKYKLTFQATGCPNSNPHTAWWKTQTDTNAFNDMHGYCTLAKEGTASASQQQQCCGSSACTPASCTKQTQFTEQVPRIADWETAQSYMSGQHEEGFGPRVMQRILQYLINDYTTQAFGRDKSSWGVAKEVWSCEQAQQDFADGVNPAADLFMSKFFNCGFKFTKEFINTWASKAVAADCATCTKTPKDASQETMTHQLEYDVIIAAKLACSKDGASFQATRLLMGCCQPLDMDAAKKCYNEAKFGGTSFDTDNCKGLQLTKNQTSAELATCSTLFTVM